MRRLFPALLAASVVLVLAFFLVPVLALFLRMPPGRLVSLLGSQAVRDALVVSLKTNLIAEALILGIGTPAAYLLARRRFRGRALAITAVELPLVLPPAVAGIALLVTFGRLGLLHGFGGLAFTQAAVVVAICFVAGPFYVRPAIAAFESVDQAQLDAARTLGAGPARVFARVALPLAAAGLGSGAALSFARGLGEFGATIMFAGRLQGVTQTLPLAIYAQLGVNLDVAIALGALLVVFSAAILLLVKLIPRWTRSGSSSLFRAATSG
jgi:molybdate transport system permease protein